MISDQLNAKIHPLIYPHPVTQKKVNIKKEKFMLFCGFLEFLTTEFINLQRMCNK